MSRDDAGTVTRLLQAARAGRADAFDELFPLVYADLRRRAVRYLRRERPGHTLQPTALVNEAYLRLVDQTRTDWQNRAHFLAIAAQAMRRVLVDHARQVRRDKRGGSAARIPLEGIDIPTADTPDGLIAVDEALDRLAAVDDQQRRIVELRFFCGLTIDETAQCLSLSPSTVKREWAMARAWLYRELGGAPA